MRKAPALIAAVFAALLLFVIGPASAQVTVEFFSGGNASAGWVTFTPAPPGDPDDQSIALEVNADNGADFDDFAGADLVGESTTLPATPPSYDFQSNVNDVGSGGSPRLVLIFGNGANAVLRPLSWTAGVWVTIDGSTNSWDVTGGPCGFQFSTNYAAVTTCEAGSGVDEVFVVSDSGWFHPGGYIHYIDNIQYDGEVITAPAPVPSCGDPDGDGDNHSNLAPQENEDGTVSGLVHEIDQAVVIPLITADRGVVPEVNCAIVKRFLDL